MKKLFLLLLISGGVALGRGAPPPKPAPIPAPIEVISDPGKVEVVLNVSGTAAQIARITRLKDVVKKIINSPEFKARVTGAYYKGKLQFVDSDLHPSQVYEVIRKGSEIGSAADYVWNLEVGIEKARCSTLGWTYPNVNKFWINSCNFSTRTDAGLVGTLCHEYQHKLGFKHSYKFTSSREYSVPYAVGTICAELYSLFK